MPSPVIAASDLRGTAVRAVPFVVLQWLVAAGTAAVADGYDAAPWWLLLLNQLVLAPAAIVAVLCLGVALGGRSFGLLAGLVLVLLPLFGVAYALSKYRDTYVDRVLTEAVGVAGGGRFPAAALSVVAAAMALRSLTGDHARTAAALSGLAAGSAALVHPAGALVLVGIALAYAVGWRPVEAGLCAGAAAPALAAAAATHGLGLDVSWDAFSGSMAGLREYLWSNRVLQWLPVAGAIGAARGSLPVACLLGGWFGAFAVVYGASPQASVEDGSFLAAFVPALPAFCLLVACVSLLVPTLSSRLARLEREALNPLARAPGGRPSRGTPASAERRDR